MNARLITLCAVLGATGCQRIAKEPAELGTETSKAEINQAIAKAMTGVGVGGVRSGQSVAFVTTRRIGAGDVEKVLGGETMSVVADPAAAGRPKLLIDVTARDDAGQMKTTRRERSVALDTAVARAAADAPAPPGVSEATVTYHRLRTGREAVAAPAAVRARPGCGGVPDCTLDVRYVIFDVIARRANAPFERTTITLGFSPHPPYLPYGDGFDRFNGALVVDCRAQTVRIGEHPVPVQDCRRLVDFDRRERE